MQILSIGEVLWDVFGEQEFLGGAPLNFSAVAKQLGNSAALLTAVGADARGARALKEMAKLGLSTDFVQTVKERPTGTAIVSTDSEGNAVFTIDRPAAFDCLQIDDSLLVRTAQLEPDWIYFGTLAQADPQMEKALIRLIGNLSNTRRFYDVNLRSGHWCLPLVQRLSSAADVLKLNDAEAELLYRCVLGKDGFSLEGFCRYWASTYEIATICVTLGNRGCAIFADDALRTFRGYTVNVVDTVGAGDAFAAALLHGLHRSWSMERTTALANSLGAIVASRAGATPAWTIDECLNLVARQSRGSGSENKE